MRQKDEWRWKLRVSLPRDRERMVFRQTTHQPTRCGRNVLGWLAEDWCADAEGWERVGWFWKDRDRNMGETFPLMRDALADFERHINFKNTAKIRRAANEFPKEHS